MRVPEPSSAARRPSRGARAKWLTAAVLLVVVGVGGGLRAHRAVHPWPHASADEQGYAHVAIGFAERSAYGSPAERRNFQWAPGAPLAFAVADRVAGRGRDASDPTDVPGAYALQAAAGTALIVVVFGLGYLLAGAAAGLAAAAVTALYPPLIVATGDLLSEPVGALALTAAMVALASGVKRPPAPWPWLSCGLLLGYASLVRADLLGFTVLLILIATVWAWRRLHRRAAATVCLALAVGAAIPLGPWFAFAWSQTGRFVPVTGAGPSALVVGTNLPTGGGLNAFKRRYGSGALRRVVRARPDESPSAAKLGVVEWNLRRYALGQPLAFAKMMATKAWATWGQAAGASSRYGLKWINVVHLVVFIPLLIALLLATWRTGHLVLITALTAILYTALLNALVIPTPRHNLPIMPLLIAAGVGGLGLLAARAGEARRL